MATTSYLRTILEIRTTFGCQSLYFINHNSQACKYQELHCITTMRSVNLIDKKKKIFLKTMTLSNLQLFFFFYYYKGENYSYNLRKKKLYENTNKK
jgi:hypothetical protein